MKKTIKPTDSELDILNILWRNGYSTVKFINEELRNEKEVGYTTTLKLLQIMFEKGLVTRRKEGRGHVYNYSVGQSDTQNLLLDKILKTAFGGSSSKLVMRLLGNKKISAEEIDQIKSLLNEKEKNTK